MSSEKNSLALAGSLTNSSSFSKVLLLFSLTVFFYSVTSLILSSLKILFPNIAQSIYFEKIAQFIISVTTFGLSALLSLYFTEKNVLNGISERKITLKKIFTIVAIFVLIIPTINNLESLGENLKVFFEKSEKLKIFIYLNNKIEQTTLEYLKVDNFADYILNVIVFAITPAFLEELYFRASFQKYLINLFRNAHLGIVFTSIVFSAVHFQVFQFLPRILLSIFLGYIFFYSKNVIYPATFHFLNNFLTVTAFFVLNEQQIKALENNQFFVKGHGLIISLIFMIFAVFLLLSLKKSKEKETTS